MTIICILALLPDPGYGHQYVLKWAPSPTDGRQIPHVDQLPVFCALA